VRAWEKASDHAATCILLAWPEPPAQFGLERVEPDLPSKQWRRFRRAILFHGVISVGAPTPVASRGPTRRLRNPYFHHFRDSTGGYRGRRQLNGGEMLQGISAITLATHNMARAVAFYEALGFVLKFGGPDADFTSFRAGTGYLNLVQMPAERTRSWWGRAIFYVDDVDAQHARAVSAGLAPAFSPRDAPWGERCFHIVDPDGHELSFARPL
jgi:catechol 2,3-dioxygenase-like lactoylglutathione lyase family enzyme